MHGDFEQARKEKQLLVQLRQKAGLNAIPESWKPYKAGFLLDPSWKDTPPKGGDEEVEIRDISFAPPARFSAKASPSIGSAGIRTAPSVNPLRPEKGGSTHFAPNGTLNGVPLPAGQGRNVSYREAVNQLRTAGLGAQDFQTVSAWLAQRRDTSGNLSAGDYGAALDAATNPGRVKAMRAQNRQAAPAPGLVTPTIDNPRGLLDPSGPGRRPNLVRPSADRMLAPFVVDALSGDPRSAARRKDPRTLDGAMAAYDREHLGYETGGRPTGNAAFDAGRREMLNSLRQILNTTAYSYIRPDVDRGMGLMEAIEKHKDDLRSHWHWVMESQFHRGMMQHVDHRRGHRAAAQRRFL